MHHVLSRTSVSAPLVAVLIALSAVSAASGRTMAASSEVSSAPATTQILGRPTAHSVALSVLASTALQVYAEYGTTPRRYTDRTPTRTPIAGAPQVLTLSGLKANTRYFYRLRSRQAGGAAAFATGPEYSFHTQRAPGSTFTFALQADSHPERRGKMFDPALYRLTLQNVAREHPDFYLSLGDDFSIDPLVNAGTLSRQTVDQLYVNQRGYLGVVGRESPLFLVNGNHEQGARVLLDGTATSPAVLVGNARTEYFPLPAPGSFYSGDTEKVPNIGLLRDYYAWTWGDALFAVIDPYWHSPVQVDSGLGGQKGGGKKNRDMWGITIGDAQYQWLKKTLEDSTAKYKFVFAHHVMGTGRGGIEEAGLYEWGGKDPSGADEFASRRPGWALPIQQLMARTHVTIFFQGHDHLFARQSLGGVVYQETPIPADPTYTAFNQVAYRSGTILPNTGHLLITVSPSSVRVDYVRSYLPKDVTSTNKNGTVVYSYSLTAGR